MTNFAFANLVRTAIDELIPGSQDFPAVELRVYDDSGIERKVIDVYMKDGIICLDTERVKGKA